MVDADLIGLVVVGPWEDHQLEYEAVAADLCSGIAGAGHIWSLPPDQDFVAISLGIGVCPWHGIQSFERLDSVVWGGPYVATTPDVWLPPCDDGGTGDAGSTDADDEFWE